MCHRCVDRYTIRSFYPGRSSIMNRDYLQLASYSQNLILMPSNDLAPRECWINEGQVPPTTRSQNVQHQVQ
jgi:hypothetical protein